VDLAEVVDLGRYPVHDERRRATLVVSAAQQLTDRSVAVLPGFVRPAALERMVYDCDTLLPLAHRSESDASPYLSAPDPTLPPAHPRARHQASQVSTVAYDLVPATAPVRTLYESDVLLGFLAAVLGVDRLYRYDDPFGALNLSTMHAGDELAWHFDQTDFVTSLAVAAPDAGGAFEVAAQVRTSDDERYEQVAAVLDGDRSAVTHVEFRPGSLMLFAGRHSLHRVTAVEGARPRHVALLAYDTRPGTDSTDELKLARYGRLPGGTPS
jgi:hypothetical protein